MAWAASDRLSIIWKCDLFDKMQTELFQVVAILELLDGCTQMVIIETLGEKARW